jgi:membrane dipeptidase
MKTGFEQSRRAMLKTLGGASLALCSNSSLGRMYADEVATDPRVTKIVAETISVDMHNHAYQPPYAKGAEETGADLAIDLSSQMKKAGLSAVCFTYAVDGDRSPQPGDWYQYHLQNLANADRMLKQNDMRRALSMKDLKAAHAENKPIVIQDCEGAQWIDGRLERVEEAYKRGLRHMQLVHQMHALSSPLAGVQQLIQPTGSDPNSQVADISGLTPFGADVIRECNRLGIVVDLAHATEAAVFAALKVARHPLVVTHTALDNALGRSDNQYVGNPGLTARLVSREYAKAVADACGVVGIWHIFPTLKEFVTAIKQMVEVVGVEHTGIGTDTSVAPPAGRGAGTNAIWPDQHAGFIYAVAGEMLAQGFHPQEISRVAGGNYCRVFDQVTRGHAAL